MDLKHFSKKILQKYGDLNPEVGYTVIVPKGDNEFWGIDDKSLSFYDKKHLSFGTFKLNNPLPYRVVKNYKTPAIDDPNFTLDSVIDTFFEYYTSDNFNDLNDEEKILTMLYTLQDDISKRQVLMKNLLCFLNDPKLKQQFEE